MKEIECFRKLGKEVIAIEAQTLQLLHQNITEDFSQACELLLNCKGRVVVVGMGKSGHIGKKIAATFASTGTPAFYVHPGEASHGDLGMITQMDVVLALSYSGETFELINLLPLFRELDIPVIAVTGNPNATLGREATFVIPITVEREACTLGLAPTASTTAMLAIGDALAITLQKVRGFSAEDFARLHPGGALGARLRLSIQDFMHKGNAIPMVKPTCLLHDALIEITAKSLGMTTVIDDSGKLLGVFTDGDLRRTLGQGYNIQKTQIGEVMTRNGVTIGSNVLVPDALKMMERHKITSLVVVDETHAPKGIVHMHDLLTIGLV